jgi:hypothetical protein
MPNYSKSLTTRLQLITAASFFLFCLACRTPLQITDVKVSNSCDNLCLSWTTNYDAKCKISFCDLSQCYITDLEPEWGLLHSNTIQKGVHDIKIYDEGKDGQTAFLEVK